MSLSENSPKPKWYYGLVPVILGLVLMGPFAFPLLWKSPNFNLAWKVILTLSVTALTVWTIWITGQTIKLVINQVRSLGLM